MNNWIAPMMVVDTDKPARQAASNKRVLEQAARGVRVVAGKLSGNIEAEKLVVQVDQSPIAHTMSDVGRAYYEGHRTGEQTDMPGPPHCYVWGAFILALLKACE
eukprot:9045119-Heterocapsa_arctica.AAC.1